MPNKFHLYLIIIFNSKRENHACGKILKEKMSNEFTVIVVGGFNEEYMDSVEVLVMKLMSWTTGPSLTIGNYFASMIELPSCDILLVGGSALSINYLNTMLEHAEDSWQQLDQKLETGRKEFFFFHTIFQTFLSLPTIGSIGTQT